MKRLRVETYFEWIRTTFAILISMLLSMLIIFLVSKEPLHALQSFLIGPVLSLSRIGNVVEGMIPLLFTGLAICVMFEPAQFSMAAEGSFFFGAFMAAVVAVALPLPAGIHPLAALLLGGLAGALVTAIPAVLKWKWGVNEFVVSLMLNYVVRYLVMYLLTQTIRDPAAGNIASYPFLKTATFATLIAGTRIKTSIILAVVTTVLVYLFLRHTRWGYKIRLSGMNSTFAQLSGIKTPIIIFASQLIGGFIAGVGGATELLSLYERFKWLNLPGYGFDGIVVASIARYNPKMVPIAAFFIAYIRIGMDIMGRTADVPNELISVIYAAVIVLVVAKSFLSKQQHRLVVRESHRNERGGA